MAQERGAEEQARAAAEEQARIAASKSAADRQEALNQARANNEAARENYMAGAAVLLVLGALCVGGAGLLASRNQQREAIWVGVGAGVLFLGAAALFFSRPSFDASKVVAVPALSNESAALPTQAPTGKLVCTLDPKRGRVTVSNTTTVAIDIGEDGCINAKTQYAEEGAHWQRILVPNDEATVSVLDFDPATRTYTNTRYLLSSDAMNRARQLRAAVSLKNCSQDQAARGQLATRQQEIKAALPPQYNEKLVYSCAPAQ